MTTWGRVHRVRGRSSVQQVGPRLMRTELLACAIETDIRIQ